jgi:hypothetical protein
MPRRAEDDGGQVTVELWRDYDADAQRVRGMAMGVRRLAGSSGQHVAQYYADGARFARVVEPVQLCPDGTWASGRALMLIRDLTAHGFAVRWTAHCREGCRDSRLFSHLYPPTTVVCGSASAETTRAWRERFFVGKCGFRHGPGFVEVRDRRSGVLELLTISDQPHLAAIGPLTEGVAATAVPAGVRRDFADAELIAEHAGRLWWLPTRMYRWPSPALAI